MDIALENILLLPIGICISSFASLVGIGGGLLWAPYFMLVRGFEPQMVVLYSFLMQCVGMSSATFTNVRKKNIFWGMALRLLPFVIAGVLAGSFLNRIIDSAKLSGIALGTVCLVIAVIFTFRVEKYDTEMQLDRTLRPSVRIRFMTLGFGSISGLLSIGISDFLVPLFRSWLKMPMRYAIGTSLALNVTIALTGGFFNLYLASDRIGFEMLHILLFGWCGVFLGGQIGPRLMMILDDGKVKEIFIFVLLLMGIHLIYKSL